MGKWGIKPNSQVCLPDVIEFAAVPAKVGETC